MNCKAATYSAIKIRCAFWRNTFLTNERYLTIDASKCDAVTGATSNTRHVKCGLQSTLRRGGQPKKKRHFARTMPEPPNLFFGTLYSP